MARKPNRRGRRTRRKYSDEMQAEAVQMLLDGPSAAYEAQHLGLSGTGLLHRSKAKQLEESGPAVNALDARVHQLEEELRRVERERDILKKALAIFSQKT